MKYLAIFDKMWFLATGPMVTVLQILRIVFQVRELPVYSQEACTFKNKINSRTKTVASSVANTSPFAF